MKALETPTVRIVLYEGTGAQPFDDGQRYDLMRTLLSEGFTVTCTGSAVDAGRMNPGTMASVDESTLIVLGRFDDGTAPEASDAAGEVTLHLREIGESTGEAAVQIVRELLDENDIETNKPGKWKPWFPVIDYDRCTNCMQCLSFCLFDVYGTSDDGQIQVQNNDNCKTDCPACSRVCPEVAIMFPKYSGGPINGDVVRDEDMKREAMKVDISAMLGGDIYSTLRNRHDAAKERFAKERDEKRAISERMRCLSQMVKDGTIPASALKDLPSQDEIKQKAADAKAKAEAAMNQTNS
ncbi:MAG: ferredoxin family protein [Phycisphaeraceae bacterium]